MTCTQFGDAVVCTTGPYRKESKPDGKPRWCFQCRKRVPFLFVLSIPTEPSYYGASPSIRCEPAGHMNGDLFPGGYREWDES